MQELKTLKENCVDALRVTEGKDLEISANITSPKQIPLIMQGYLYSQLRSKYVTERTQMYLRLTISYNARMRDDVVGIGKSPDFAPPTGGPTMVGQE